MDLLQSPADRGYPPEYLLSRIRGRRSTLIRDWRPWIYDPSLFESPSSLRPGSVPRAASPGESWGNLMREYQWVYRQMDNKLRGIFHPYFLYAELRTVFICLRRLADRKAGGIDELLDRSLLADELKKVLVLSTELANAVAGVGQMFSLWSPGFSGLAEVLKTNGLRGVEQRLTETYLAVTIAGPLHPLMKRFFSGLIDARNIMSLYKYLRLDLKDAPSFIPGGSIAGARMKAIADKDDVLGVGPLIRECTGLTMDRPDPTTMELALYRGMTRWLKKSGRDPFGAAPILDYLWRCSIEAMNLSVLYFGKDLEREAVTAELVQ